MYSWGGGQECLNSDLMAHVKQPGCFSPCQDRLICPFISLPEGRTVWGLFSTVFFSADECAIRIFCYSDIGSVNQILKKKIFNKTINKISGI